MYIFKELTPAERTDLGATLREIDLLENDEDVIHCEINSYEDDSIQLAVEDREYDSIGIVTCTINQADGKIVGVIEPGSSMENELLDVILNEMNDYEPSFVEEVDENENENEYETNNENENENEMVVQMNIAPVETRPPGNEPATGGSRKKKSKRSKKSKKSKRSKKSKKSKKSRKTKKSRR